ncbi:MAG TPA: response regulator [Candidatus Saccharimonadales bacterium]|nr:response regulator [Candidatus Saccharimonadales bacterium]
MAKKILVCEDDEGISGVLSIILSEKGYEVKILSSAKGLVKKVINFSPNLILMDIRMSGVDGREAIKILKTDLKTKKVPIIIVSALDDLASVVKATGADGFLTKPFEIKDLVAVIKKNLN